jgi:hypothetical protein
MVYYCCCGSINLKWASWAVFGLNLIVFGLKWLLYLLYWLKCDWYFWWAEIVSMG